MLDREVVDVRPNFISELFGLGPVRSRYKSNCKVLCLSYLSPGNHGQCFVHKGIPKVGIWLLPEEILQPKLPEGVMI